MSDKPKNWDELNDRQKYQVERYIQTLLAQQEELPLFQKPGREVLQQNSFGDGVTYQLEKIKCGKKTCKCADGKYLHGPYWYAYWRDGKKIKCRYIGKELKRLEKSEADLENLT